MHEWGTMSPWCHWNSRPLSRNFAASSEYGAKRAARLRFDGPTPTPVKSRILFSCRRMATDPLWFTDKSILRKKRETSGPTARQIESMRLRSRVSQSVDGLRLSLRMSRQLPFGKQCRAYRRDDQA